MAPESIAHYINMNSRLYIICIIIRVDLMVKAWFRSSTLVCTPKSNVIICANIKVNAKMRIDANCVNSGYSIAANA